MEKEIKWPHQQTVHHKTVFAISQWANTTGGLIPSKGNSQVTIE